ncbi:aromatic acid exporter family protein [Streptomyces sp. NPDC057382]|uniref:FUSC family protein n=1 Tax=unclassified Streptomyces TaxID=2593676 RepID=UPI00363FA44C
MTRVRSALRRTAGAVRPSTDSGTADGTEGAAGPRAGAAAPAGNPREPEHRAVALRPVDAVRRDARSARDAVRAAWRGPGRERDLVIQSLKAALAAVIAWLVGGVWMDDPLALMAPWVALVLVQATIYSSLMQGARQFGAICVGTVLASAAQAVTGDTTAAIALSVPVLMLLANWQRFGDQGIYAATTALFTIAAGTVSLAGVGHRVGQAAVGAVIGVAVNALILPPIHLRDVRENLVALAREVGDVLHTVAGDLREGEWDGQTAAGWVGAAARLDHRLGALHSARRWSQESLRLTSGPLRALHRVPHAAALPPVEEDERLGRITGHVTALTRALAVSVDDERTPAPPGGEALRSYARLLELIGDACRAQAENLSEGSLVGRPDEETEKAMRELHEELQDRLRRHAEEGAERTAVLGTLLLQAENLWAETVPPVEEP